MKREKENIQTLLKSKEQEVNELLQKCQHAQEELAKIKEHSGSSQLKDRTRRLVRLLLLNF